MFYRRPFDEQYIGRNITAGPFMHLYRTHGPVGSGMITVQIDGVKRLYSYRHLNGFPLIVAAALSEGEIYGTWRKSALQLVGVLLFFINCSVKPRPSGRGGKEPIAQHSLPFGCVTY
jgi:hypothetical protein